MNEQIGNPVKGGEMADVPLATLDCIEAVSSTTIEVGVQALVATIGLLGKQVGFGEREDFKERCFKMLEGAFLILDNLEVQNEQPMCH